jgi:dihydroorotase
MDSYHIINVQIVNEGIISFGEVFIKNGFIEKINLNTTSKTPLNYQLIDGDGNYLIPGIIDTHVHFREPGYSDKATIYTESLAALYGGVTSFIDMPNTLPPTTNKSLLEQKLDIASKDSFVNYGFYLAAVDDNLSEIQKINPSELAGIKVFWGNTTGNLSLKNSNVINQFFQLPYLIAVHSEDNDTIDQNKALYLDLFNNDVFIHPIIRNLTACINAAKDILKIATNYNTRLHYLHISHIDELNFIYQYKNKLTYLSLETCPHYLYFDLSDYNTYGNLIKVNPAIKSTKEQRLQLLNSLSKIDTIASDHAPHMRDEKLNQYELAPSGLPSIQHELGLMWALSEKNYLSLPDLINKMSHKPAQIFRIDKRGFIREGYYADLVLLKNNNHQLISSDILKYKCGWTPYENIDIPISIDKVWINGQLMLDNDNLNNIKAALPLQFNNSK